MANIAYPLTKPVEVLQAMICAMMGLHQGDLTGIQCRLECARDYIFVKDRRIKSNISYFESTTFSDHTPFQFVQDSFNKMLSITCSSNNYVESLIFTERMSLQFANNQSLKFIRLRITFYLQEFLTDNEIQILLDDYIQGEIIKATTFNKVTTIKSSLKSFLKQHNQPMQLRYRDSEITQFIVVIVKKIVQSVIFQHVNNVTLVMQSGFVYACPVHSVNIVDYADIVPIVIQISQNILQYDTKLPLFSKSILQFYMSTSDINQYFDQNTLTGNNFLRGQKFSIFPSKFALDDMEQCNRQKIMDYIQSSLCGYYLIQFYIWR